MNGPPTTSVARIASNSSEGDAFMCTTFMPSRTGSVQARTPGASSTCTRQFGHCPAQHMRPRLRWYLKLRENVRRPAANSAEPIVSPSKARYSLPSKLKRSSRLRSMRSPLCSGRRVTRRPRGPDSSVNMTSLVRVSRSAMNHAPHPERWFHHSRWTPATFARK